MYQQKWCPHTLYIKETEETWFFYSYIFFSFFHSYCNRDKTKLNMQKVKFYLNIHVLSIIFLSITMKQIGELGKGTFFHLWFLFFLVILIFQPSQYSVYNCIVAVWISYISAWMHQKFPYNVYWILCKNLYHDYNVVMSNRLFFLLIIYWIFFFFGKIFGVVECMLSCLMEHYGVLPKKYDTLKHVFCNSMSWFRYINLTI